MKIRNMAIILAAAGFGLIFAACDEGREARTETRVVDAGDAVSASVLVRMGAGELRISGGAASLLEAEFTTNRERWVPELDYRVLGGRGRLEVRQRKGRRIFLGNIRNEWDLRLAGALPLALEVKLGAGESRLDLSGVNLEALDVDMGVGELNLDLTGPRTRDLEVRIDGGIGSATIRLPRDVGIRVDVDGGIGSVSAHGFIKDGHRYVNEAFGKTAAAIRMKVDAGIGSIDLRTE